MEPRIFPIYPPSSALFAKILTIIFIVNCFFFALLSLGLYAVINPEGMVAQVAAPVALISSLLLMLFIFFSVFIWFWLSATKTDFGLIETHLVIRNNAHGRHFSYAELKAGEAKIVDLDAESDYRTSKKIFAIKAFFFSGGAFYLHNGEKAHVFVTGSPRAVYVPTTGTHALVLGPQDPEGFLQELQQRAMADG